ncbi:MAG: hypothetical protein KJ787_10660 [Gammaproteobacteria bacterium]|nr:hypothetical protein [Gammaproteobacteria bacterium]MBU1646783.1 hypothetical protein [Gammaproteobacteria bacterium]MBU1971551.1 hypothetical protein [Gammaproteobacteria bacterium]
MLVYLGICAVLAFLMAALAAFLAVPPAPTFGFAESHAASVALAISPAAVFHIAFAAGAMPLVFGAIIHFVPVLTRTSSPHAAIRLMPLPVQLAGIAAAAALAGSLPQWSLHAAASTTGLVALALVGWIFTRLRATLGTPHPGARWYAGALLALLLAVAVVPLLLARPEWRGALRLFHLHLNTLGFIGLAALATLPVLLPTVLGRPEPTIAARLRRDWWLAAGGALLVAAGAAVFWLLAVIGALLLAWVALRDMLAWNRAYGLGKILGDGATAPLAAATLGLALLLLLGIVHGAGLMEARPAIASYAVGFLLPLVTGALTQLLPVWRHPGADSPARRTMRQRLARGGQLRATLFLTGGGLLVLDNPAGAMLGAAAMLLFGAVLLHAVLAAAPAGPA